MAAVVDLAGVSIVRNGSTLISDITWEVDEADRWVVIGPDGRLLHRGFQIEELRSAIQGSLNVTARTSNSSESAGRTSVVPAPD